MSGTRSEDSKGKGGSKGDDDGNDDGNEDSGEGIIMMPGFKSKGRGFQGQKGFAPRVTILTPMTTTKMMMTTSPYY